MYDIRQFKPALYILILLSIAGFAVAAESLTMWALGTAAVLLNARLVRKNLFRALPRLASNLVTIGALLYVVHEVLTTGATAVLMIGEFLMLLQVVKLWEQRGNRDYAQLLVLSLLLMVAAAISTASIIFGLMLIAFLFLSLYCCLLFHLKVETDAAKQLTVTTTRKPSSTELQQDQRHLTQSMRKLTTLVSGVAIVFAVAVFILFPRGTGAGMLGPVQFKANQSLVGFTDEVGFQNIARIQQNDEIVAQVELSHNKKPVRGGFPLLLRGVTLDAYTGKEGGWRWIRWPRQGFEDVHDGFIPEVSSDSELSGVAIKGEVAKDRTQNLMDIPEPNDVWSQQITLRPTGTDVLFAMAGPYRITPHQALSFRFSGRDFELRNSGLHDRDRPPDVLSYEVLSTNDLGNTPPPVESGTDPREGGIIAKEIRDYALRPDVSGMGAAASLGSERYERFRKLVQSHLPAVRREPAMPDDLDEKIARNIEHHLKTNFGYTLDLTDTRRIEGRDPMVAFLYDFKKGHCEYFAGAMTLMCQSLGMRARICAGFRSDEYNSTPGANWYIIRQSHAHTWVEVFTKNGWMTFDPTSEDDAAEQAKHAGFMQNIRHLFNFLEYSYGHAVIAYSNEDRTNLIQRTEGLMFRATLNTSMTLDGLRRLRIDSLLANKTFLTASSRALAIIILFAAAGVPIFIARFAWERWKLRQRAARIGIASLPHDRQLRLALQLKFYDDLLQLLGRHRMSRLPHQTPLEFSRSLLTLPADAYETVRRLTELFYRVRYGDGVLTAARQRHLGVVIQRLAGELESRST